MLDNVKFERNFNIEIETVIGKINEVEKDGKIVTAGVTGETITISRPFTIEFSVIRNTLASANNATIKIYNLSERIRNLIYKDRFATVEDRKIILRAGYGEDAPIIFFGEIRSADSYREGVNFITAIDALDGALDMYKTISSNTAAKGTLKIDALKNQVNNFTNIKNLTIGDFGGTYKRGRVFYGNTWDLLGLETKNKNSVDNGQLNILNDDEVKEGGIRVINADSGLLSSPRRSNTQLVFKVLFEPRFIIGQKVELTSQTNKIFNGKYKVTGASHSGTISDAVSGKCETEVSLNMGAEALRVV